MIINEFTEQDWFGFAGCVAPAFRSKLTEKTALNDDWYLASKLGDDFSVDVVLHAEGAEVCLTGNNATYVMNTKETNGVDYELLDKLCNLDPKKMTVKELMKLGFSIPEVM